jgi:flagellar basal-body rod protein FlgF
MLYIAMAGIKHVFQAQATNSHNLANVSTVGFRADRSQFRSMPVFGPGFPSRVYAMEEHPGADFSPGAINATGRELDVAIDGAGWIAVQAPDGSEAYSRAGDLRIESSGILVTGAGHPVLSDAGPIALPPAEKIEIGADGTISLRPPGEPSGKMVQVERIKLVNPPSEALEKGADGLMHMKGGVTAPPAPVQLVSGALESSNVNAVEFLVTMIQLARQFEMQVKAMRAAEDNDAAVTEMMRIS